MGFPALGRLVVQSSLAAPGGAAKTRFLAGTIWACTAWTAITRFLPFCRLTTPSSRKLIVNGVLVTNGTGYTVTYQAVADPAGSFNSTAAGKGNYYNYVAQLYGAGSRRIKVWPAGTCPGTTTSPQSMFFEQTNYPAAGVATPVNWFRAEGIPLSPYDDAHNKNPYPMMRLIARNAANQAIATNDIVLPVSDEMDCRACHASGTQRRAAGRRLGLGRHPERDFRLNILRLHDRTAVRQSS